MSWTEKRAKRVSVLCISPNGSEDYLGPSFPEGSTDTRKTIAKAISPGTQLRYLLTMKTMPVYQVFQLGSLLHLACLGVNLFVAIEELRKESSGSSPVGICETQKEHGKTYDANIDQKEKEDACHLVCSQVLPDFS